MLLLPLLLKFVRLFEMSLTVKEANEIKYRAQCRYMFNRSINKFATRALNDALLKQPRKMNCDLYSLTSAMRSVRKYHTGSSSFQLFTE